MIELYVEVGCQRVSNITEQGQAGHRRAMSLAVVSIMAHDVVDIFGVQRSRKEGVRVDAGVENANRRRVPRSWDYELERVLNPIHAESQVEALQVTRRGWRIELRQGGAARTESCLSLRDPYGLP